MSLQKCGCYYELCTARSSLYANVGGTKMKVRLTKSPDNSQRASANQVQERMNAAACHCYAQFTGMIHTVPGPFSVLLGVTFVTRLNFDDGKRALFKNSSCFGLCAWTLAQPVTLSCKF